MNQRIEGTIRNLVILIILTLLLWPAGILTAQERTPEPQEGTPEANVYVVQRGDTLFEIAERFGTTVKAIVVTNDIEDSRIIFPGQKLFIE